MPTARRRCAESRSPRRSRPPPGAARDHSLADPPGHVDCRCRPARGTLKSALQRRQRRVETRSGRAYTARASVRHPPGSHRIVRRRCGDAPSPAGRRGGQPELSRSDLAHTATVICSLDRASGIAGRSRARARAVSLAVRLSTAAHPQARGADVDADDTKPAAEVDRDTPAACARAWPGRSPAVWTSWGPAPSPLATTAETVAWRWLVRS